MCLILPERLWEVHWWPCQSWRLAFRPQSWMTRRRVASPAEQRWRWTERGGRAKTGWTTRHSWGLSQGYGVVTSTCHGHKNNQCINRSFPSFAIRQAEPLQQNLTLSTSIIFTNIWPLASKLKKEWAQCLIDFSPMCLFNANNISGALIRICAFIRIWKIWMALNRPSRVAIRNGSRSG